MRPLRIVLLLPLTVLLFAIPVHASPSASSVAAGPYTITVISQNTQIVNGFAVVTQHFTVNTMGGAAGAADSQDIAVVNLSTGTGFFAGTGTFTGSVLGRAGTVSIAFGGSITGFASLSAKIEFVSGTGTGQLAGVEGHGNLQGTFNVGGTYSIQVSFESD